MAGDYYSGGDDEAAPMEAGADPNEGGEPQAEEHGEESVAETGLANKSIFGGNCKPGDRYTIEVVAVHDNELEYKPVKQDGSKGEPEPRSTGDSMGRMAKYADRP